MNCIRSYTITALSFLLLTASMLTQAMEVSVDDIHSALNVAQSSKRDSGAWFGIIATKLAERINCAICEAAKEQPCYTAGIVIGLFGLIWFGCSLYADMKRDRQAAKVSNQASLANLNAVEQQYLHGVKAALDQCLAYNFVGAYAYHYIQALNLDILPADNAGNAVRAYIALVKQAFNAIAYRQYVNKNYLDNAYGQAITQIAELKKLAE
jgi:hypothetical protein